MRIYAWLLMVVSFAGIANAAQEKFKIDNLSVQATGSTVTVTWQTAVDADSRLIYSTNAVQLHQQYATLLLDKKPKRKHEMKITYLPGGLPIHLFVESHTGDGQKAKSADRDLITPAYLRTVLALGPLDNDTALDLKKIRPSFDETISGKSWIVVSTLEDKIDLAKELKSKSGQPALAAVYVFSSEPKSLNLEWKSGGKSSLYLNGELLQQAENKCPASIRKGWNLLLAEVTTGSPFSAHFLDSEGNDVIFPKHSFIDPEPRFEVTVDKISDNQRKVSWNFKHPYISPKWIQSGWYRLSIKEMQEMLPELEKKYWYFDGITLDFKPDRAIKRGFQLRPFSTTTPIDYSKIESQVKAIGALPFKRWKHNFWWSNAYLNTPRKFVDWVYDQKQWDIVLANFRTIGRIMKETNTPRLFIDAETGSGEPFIFDYEGEMQKRHPNAEETIMRAHERGKEVMEVLQQQCGNNVVIIGVDKAMSIHAAQSILQFHNGRMEQSSTIPGKMHDGGEFRLFTAFLAGMLRAAKGDSRVIDGETASLIGGLDQTLTLARDVMPNWTMDPDQVMPHSQWVRHYQNTERVTTYYKPDMDKPHAGIYEKFKDIGSRSNSDYLWLYWMQYVPSVGWWDFSWIPRERRAEMVKQVKEGKFAKYTPSLTEGKPPEFFAAMDKARNDFGPQVILKQGALEQKMMESDEIVITLKPGESRRLELIGRTDAGKTVKTIELE